MSRSKENGERRRRSRYAGSTMHQQALIGTRFCIKRDERLDLQHGRGGAVRSGDYVIEPQCKDRGADRGEIDGWRVIRIEDRDDPVGGRKRCFMELVQTTDVVNRKVC